MNLRLRSLLRSLPLFIVSLCLLGIILPLLLRPAQLRASAGNGVNVILMIGDGMGWEMARAAAIARGAPMYTSGKGSGLSFQTLTGYAIATTYGTTIQGEDGRFLTNNSALDGSVPATGQSRVRHNFAFKPLPFNPGTTASGEATDATLGNLVGYDPRRGGSNPWTPIHPALAQAGGYDKEYIKYSLPDSANTATALYTGVKSYNNAIGVDIYERKLTTIQQKAALLGKSTGVVTSVPITHATPGAAIASVNRRSKYDNDHPFLDNILQQSLRLFQPTVLLGGGHPLDFENETNTGPVAKFEYIRESTYTELNRNPINNRYGYRFLERGANAAQTLTEVAQQIDPNQGDRLLGLYGARGQNGNLPTRGADGAYRLTGLDNYSLSFTALPNNQIPQNDSVRPLASGETVEQFIAKERDQNPTLADLTQAALDVLGRDPDGFWLMVEGGDIDWAAHDNNLDNLIGTMLSFDDAVQTVLDWISTHGGWRKNALIVTADHDHYLTLNDNFPMLLAQRGATALTFTEHQPMQAGHFWGSDPNVKYGWTSHSNRPVPVYFQGDALDLAAYIGKGYTAYGYEVPGIADLIDQTHIYQAMLAALNTPLTKQ